jgi:hypothetical protein
MSETQRLADIEMLARMAARLAARDPDERATLKIGQVTVYEGEMWRYPDFLGRAKEAYDVLRRSPSSVV